MMSTFVQIMIAVKCMVNNGHNELRLIPNALILKLV
jgi:hypothetical protein